MSCNPSGSPSLFNPAGTDIPGKPAKLTVTVKTSFKYISTGSAVSNFPSSKAADGVVGVKIASIPAAKTSSKSFFIRDLTFLARL